MWNLQTCYAWKCVFYFETLRSERDVGVISYGLIIWNVRRSYVVDESRTLDVIQL